MYVLQIGRCLFLWGLGWWELHAYKTPCQHYVQHISVIPFVSVPLGSSVSLSAMLSRLSVTFFSPFLKKLYRLFQCVPPLPPRPNPQTLHQFLLKSLSVVGKGDVLVYDEVYLTAILLVIVAR